MRFVLASVLAITRAEMSLGLGMKAKGWQLMTVTARQLV